MVFLHKMCRFPSHSEKLLVEVLCVKLYGSLRKVRRPSHSVSRNESTMFVCVCVCVCVWKEGGGGVSLQGNEEVN